MHARISLRGTYVHVQYGSQKKFPFFETRYHATVILCSVFISVPFYNRSIACDVITRARDDIRHVGVTGPVIALVLCFQNDTEKMVICAIVGCCKNSKRVQGISFYRLPAVIKSSRG